MFEQCVRQGYLTGFIVGGATKDFLALHGTDRVDQDGANYRAISPIANGFDYWKMLSAMFAIQKPNPVCHLCGSSMVLRTARTGANAGAQFWGCSAYPGCRGTQPI